MKLACARHGRVGRLVHNQMESPAITSAQTASQRRFTVTQLPVLSIVKESLLLPFKYLPELVKFGKMPFILILAIDVLCYGLEHNDVPRIWTGGLMAIAHFVLFTPFSVAWTKLAIEGRPAVANHPSFAYSRTQGMYLLATLVVVLVMALCVGMPATLMRYGHQNGDNQIETLGTMLMLTGLFLFLIGFIRLSLVFPAIAIGRYAGISAAWKQTVGNFERLAAILALTYLPYLLVREAFEWYMGYHPPGLVEIFRGFVDMLLVAISTTAVAGPALAYRC